MSEPKAQLVDPQGNMNLPGMNATGVITASSFSGDGGVVTGLTGGGNLNVGVVTATSFVGDGTGHAANLTGTPNLNLGLTTATSFIGDAVGKAAGLTGTPNLNVGLITATSFAGAVTGDVTGNITGLAGSVTPGVNLNVGVATGIQWHGNGANLTGAGSSASIAQEITATGAETIIDLSDGNLIYYKGEFNTTVGFASTSAAEQITFIRQTNPNFAYNVSYSTGAVDFDATGDYLTLASTSDFNFGTGDYTFEAWLYPDDTDDRIWLNFGNTDNPSMKIYNGKWEIFSSGSKFGPAVTAGQWYHVAISRSSGTGRMFVNGVLENSWTDSLDIPNSVASIGAYPAGTYPWDGKISNLRVVKGTALYTGSFTPPTAALTNVSGTVLLCCQDTSSTTTAAVTPGTITANGDPTAGAQTISKSGTNTINASITWPSTVKWNNDTTPTLISNVRSTAMQIFHLTTGDTGASYQAWEEMNADLENYNMFMWGDGVSGVTGQNSETDYSSPVQIPGSSWSIGNKCPHDGGSTGAIKTDGTLWTWGINNGGQLGTNDLVYRSSPTQIPGTTWGLMSLARNQFALATKTDGTIWWQGAPTWGVNGQNGNIPTGLAGYRSSPTQIGTDTTWDSARGKLLSGNWSAAAIKTDGTLWTWGASSAGQLAQNNNTAYSSPKQVGTDTTWSAVTGGYNGFNAIKTDGTLWGWGVNDLGQLAQNNRTNYSSPKQIGTDTNWSWASGSEQMHMGRKTDGTLWIWGEDYQGSLGLNQEGARFSSPVQIGTGTDWAEKEFSTGGNGYAFAMKTDGTLWAWGANQSGSLGQNNETKFSSPVQIPGTSWGRTDGGTYTDIQAFQYP